MEVEKKKRGRKKKTAPDNDITRIALLAIAGRYGKGKMMSHRLVMNYGKHKAALIMAEIDTINKMVVK